jgi:hypothetical protein
VAAGMAKRQSVDWESPLKRAEKVCLRGVAFPALKGAGLGTPPLAERPLKRAEMIETAKPPVGKLAL